jgi:hypothetical protein
VTCPHCDEPIVHGEVTRLINDLGALTLFHEECVIRMVAGSAAHQLGDCACNGGTREDPPGLTKRQCAMLAFDMFNMQRGRSIPMGSFR